MKNWCETCQWGKTPWCENPPCRDCLLDKEDPESRPFSKYEEKKEAQSDE